MPRYKGPPRNLKHAVRTLLDDAGLDHLNKSMSILGATQAEALRHAVEVQFVALSSPNPTGRTIHPPAQE